MKKGPALLVIAVAALATRLPITGCDDAGSHIYTGEPFNTTLKCLAPLTSLDVVPGPEPETPCAPVCILSPEDGGTVAYVSTLCAPYPSYPYELNQSATALCAAALDAFTRDALCEDGGVVLPPGDAAAADDGGDASDASDAGLVTDASLAADVTVPIDGSADASAD